MRFCYTIDQSAEGLRADNIHSLNYIIYGERHAWVNLIIALP